MKKRIKQIIRKIRYRINPGNAVKLAREIGVRFTAEPGKEKCRLLVEPLAAFGSEPYLITIGQNVEITAGVVFITHDGAAWTLRNFDEKYSKLDVFGPIKIGDNVFIGNNAIILPGVTIGDNVVIGAGSVVSKDIPSGSVAAGVPCKVIRSLEEYGEKSLTKVGAMNTKGLSQAEKKRMIQEAHPEWFA
jgi:acetyltransferase-like isoleucine patch superfamily enzyme